MSEIEELRATVERLTAALVEVDVLRRSREIWRGKALEAATAHAVAQREIVRLRAALSQAHTALAEMLAATEPCGNLYKASSWLVDGAALKAARTRAAAAVDQPEATTPC